MVSQDAQEYINNGSKFHDLGGLDEALKCYQKALDYLKNTDDKKARADTFLEIGNIYTQREDYKNGQEYYEKSLEAYKIAEDDIGEGYALTGIGVILEKLGRFADARNFYVDAISKFENKKDRERKANNLYQIIIPKAAIRDLAGNNLH